MVSPHTVVRHPQGGAETDPGVGGGPGVFAVVRLSGTQYKVSKDDVVYTDKLPGAQVGSTLELDQVLMVGTRGHTLVGRPLVPQARVRVAVEEQTFDAKTHVFKKKRRKGYRRWNGHRRQLTVLRIMDITF